MHWFIIWSSFIAPSRSTYCLFFFSGSTVLPPSGQLFKECPNMLMSFRSWVLPIWSIFFLFDNLSCSRIKSHISTIMSYSSLIVEMKSKRCQFLKVFLEIKLLWSKTQHTLFNVIFWLSCILKTEMTRCKIKMTFSWFFVSVLIFDLGYIFWWSMMRWPSVNFKKQKGSSQNLRIHQERLFSFFELLFYQHA